MPDPHVRSSGRQAAALRFDRVDTAGYTRTVLRRRRWRRPHVLGDSSTVTV